MLDAAAGAAVGTVSLLATCCCPLLFTAIATSPACSSVAAVSSVVCGSWSMSPAAAMLVMLADAAEAEAARLEDVWKLKGLGMLDQNQLLPVVGCFVHPPPKPQPREDEEARGCLGISPGGRFRMVAGGGAAELLLLLVVVLVGPCGGGAAQGAGGCWACALPPAAREGIQTCNLRRPVWHAKRGQRVSVLIALRADPPSRSSPERHQPTDRDLPAIKAFQLMIKATMSVVRAYIKQLERPKGSSQERSVYRTPRPHRHKLRSDQWQFWSHRYNQPPAKFSRRHASTLQAMEKYAMTLKCGFWAAKARSEPSSSRTMKNVAQKHFLCTIDGPDSSYSLFAIHICWKVLRLARMEPPIQTEYLRSGGATTLIFMALGASAVISLLMRSAMPGDVWQGKDSRQRVRTQAASR